MAASPSDRNLIDLYADAGLTFVGPIRSRPDDKVGLAVSYARISDRARDLDRDFDTIARDARPIRSYEALLALDYLAEIRTGWNLYPTFQYIIHPGGGYVTDGTTVKASKNVGVFGLRTVVKF